MQGRIGSIYKWYGVQLKDAIDTMYYDIRQFQQWNDRNLVEHNGTYLLEGNTSVLAKAEFSGIFNWLDTLMSYTMVGWD